MMKQAKRVLLLILAAAMLFCSFPAAAVVSGAFNPETIEITYSFSSGGTEGGQLPTDKVTWRDDCFLRSSYLGCSHLAEVSAAAALASGAYSNPSLTPEQNEPLAPRYVKAFLSAAHFQDVETNKYYTVMAEENSAAAAFGHKTIQDGDKTYTLLAIVLRSTDYAQEWAGNFTVSDEGGSAGNMHAGFKAARDEVLRYAVQYMKNNGITGNLKVWMTGHSRGAVIANLLGGFFAGGGDGYFRAMGVPVSVLPENVYCYTFSTPRPIRPGLTHAEDLSVAGNRADYPNDTPGKAFVSTNTGSVNPGASCYKGIRNYPKYHDVVPKLPPSIADWGYTYYGQVCQYDSSDLAGGPVTEAEMLQQLRAFDSQMYKAYTNVGSPGDYQRVTLDFDKLIEKICSGEQLVIADAMKPTDKGPASLGDLMQDRVNALELVAASPREFADDYQHAAQELAGLIGMVLPDIHDPNLNVGDLVKAAVFWILDYGAKRPKGAQNEEEAAAVVSFLKELLSYLFPQESIPENLRMVDIVEMAARYIFPQSGDTKVTEKIMDLIVPALPDPGSPGIAYILYSVLDLYIPGNPESYTKAERIKAFLKACGWGPAEGTQAREQEQTKTAEGTASLLCLAVSMAGDIVPDWLKPVLEAANDPDQFPGKVMKLLQGLMPKEETWTNLAAAADLMGTRAVESLFSGPLNALAGKGYSKEYIAEARRHFNALKAKESIGPLRTLLLNTLFSAKGETLSVEGMVRNLSLFAANIGLVGPSHYVQVDLAWAKARRAKGIWDHAPVTPSKTPPKTGDAAQPILWLLLMLAGLSMCALVVRIPARRKRK